MLGSPARALLRLVLYVAVTLPLMPLQALLLLLRLPGSRRLPILYHRACCRLVGVSVEARGAISIDRPTLFVSNHLSYLDIAVISSAVEVSFVAKREVAGWPLFGWLSRLQRTVYVERRRSRVANERDELARRLSEGDNLVLFAEGTSGDGLRVLPFKSALLSVAESSPGGRPLTVQPVSLAYTRLDGMPVGRTWRPLFAWYGEMDMLPHMWDWLGSGRLTAELEFHPPATLAELGTRKALAQYCERQIAAGLAAANAGRPPPPRRAPVVPNSTAPVTALSGVGRSP